MIKQNGRKCPRFENIRENIRVLKISVKKANRFPYDFQQILLSTEFLQ